MKKTVLNHLAASGIALSFLLSGCSTEDPGAQSEKEPAAFEEKHSEPSMIPEGEADYLIAVSEDQIEVCEKMANADTVIIKPSDFPEEIASSKMLNIAMLGKLNKYLKFPRTLWEELIRESFKGEVAEANIKAFADAEEN